MTHHCPRHKTLALFPGIIVLVGDALSRFHLSTCFSSHGSSSSFLLIPRNLWQNIRWNTYAVSLVHTPIALTGNAQHCSPFSGLSFHCCWPRPIYLSGKVPVTWSHPDQTLHIHLICGCVRYRFAPSHLLTLYTSIPLWFPASARKN